MNNLTYLWISLISFSLSRALEPNDGFSSLSIGYHSFSRATAVPSSLTNREIRLGGNEWLEVRTTEATYTAV